LKHFRRLKFYLINFAIFQVFIVFVFEWSSYVRIKYLSTVNFKEMKTPLEQTIEILLLFFVWRTEKSRLIFVYIILQMICNQ